MAGPDDRSLDPIVDRVVARVRERLVQDAVPPSPVLHGTWNDATALQTLLGAGADRLGSAGGVPADAAAIARTIDHTLLSPTATRADVVKVCEEARKHGFASVCVNSVWIPLVAGLLAGSRTLPICVVGFPLGAMSALSKAAETRQAVADGAREIDMVINIGLLKGKDYDGVFDDVRAVVEAAGVVPVKVILETALLNREEKVAGCAISKAAGAAFVKTSTGFSGGGATAEDVALMRAVVGPNVGVKASGGVRTIDDARKMLAAGADRLGASASVAIVTGGAGKGAY